MTIHTQYLTRDEACRANAASSYNHRKLTPAEEVIKYVITVNAMPNGTQAEKAKKADEVETVVKVLSEHTSNDYLLSKVRLAAYDKASLKELLEGYPFVRFEGLLNGTESLTDIEQFARGGFTVEELQSVLGWAFDLHALYPHLPRGIETFIWTKRAGDYDFRSFATSTGEKKYYGYHLRKEVQDEVNKVFHEVASGYGNIRKMFHLRNYKLLDIPSIWKRASLETQAEKFLFPGVKIEFNNHTVNWKTFCTVSLIEESTNTKLHFVVSG